MSDGGAPRGEPGGGVGTTRYSAYDGPQRVRVDAMSANGENLGVTLVGTQLPFRSGDWNAEGISAVDIVTGERSVLRAAATNAGLMFISGTGDGWLERYSGGGVLRTLTTGGSETVYHERWPTASGYIRALDADERGALLIFEGAPAVRRVRPDGAPRRRRAVRLSHLQRAHRRPVHRGRLRPPAAVGRHGGRRRGLRRGRRGQRDRPRHVPAAPRDHDAVGSDPEVRAERAAGNRRLRRTVRHRDASSDPDRRGPCGDLRRRGGEPDRRPLETLTPSLPDATPPELSGGHSAYLTGSGDDRAAVVQDGAREIARYAVRASAHAVTLSGRRLLVASDGGSAVIDLDTGRRTDLVTGINAAPGQGAEIRLAGGVAAWVDQASRAVEIADLSTGTTRAVGEAWRLYSEPRSWLALSDEFVAWVAPDDSTHLLPLGVAAEGAPRYLGTVDANAFSVGADYRPQIDVSRPLSSWTLTITAPAAMVTSPARAGLAGFTVRWSSAERGVKFTGTVARRQVGTTAWSAGRTWRKGTTAIGARYAGWPYALRKGYAYKITVTGVDALGNKRATTVVTRIPK